MNPLKLFQMLSVIKIYQAVFIVSGITKYIC